MVKTFTLTKDDILKGTFHACPDTVSIPQEGINLTYKDANTLTFIVGVDRYGDLRLITSKTLVHTNLLLQYTTKYGRLDNRIEGRLWQQQHIITIWNDISSAEMDIISKLFKQVADIDISNYTFASEFDYCHAFMTSVSEFIKMGVPSEWDENTWNRFESMSNKNNNVPKIKDNIKNKLGFNDRDYMRHFMYAEGKETIKLTQQDLLEMVKSAVNLIKEGISFSANNDGTINGTINSLKTDIANKDFDTRLFGSKNDILYGDNTNTKARYNGLNNIYKSKKSIAMTYQSVIDYIKNGRKGEIYFDQYTPPKTKNSVFKLLKDPNDDNVILSAQKYLDQRSSVANVYKDTYNRINSLNDGERGDRYIKGVVPGTNVELISLFQFTDFNVSDFIKNGNFRQNNMTDKYLNIDKFEREKSLKLFGKGAAQNKKIDATYDGNKIPNIYNNFSLDKNAGVDNNYLNDKHFSRLKRNYNDDNYTTVSQFTDKSIMYAAYVLKKENIKPDFILAAPSSSQFNNNYCMRLSNKIGVEFVQDFFKRNIINVVLDKDGLLNLGLSEEKINSIESSIRSSVYREISDIISEPVIEFFKKYKSLFNNIRYKKYGRKNTILTIDNIQAFFLNYAYKVLEENIKKQVDLNDALSSAILNNLSFNEVNNSDVDTQYLQDQIINVINSNGLLSELTLCLRKMMMKMIWNRNRLIDGYKPNFSSKKFKITDVSEIVRPLLSNCYVIADKELSGQKGSNNLLARYSNAKFVIFDEDLQSGGTMKLLIQCMKDKGIKSNNIVCLVQAYGE